MSTTFSTSRRNSMKRTLGTRVDMAAPSVLAYNSNLKVTNLTISHGLGYPPVFRYFYEPFGDGVIWPPLTGRTDLDASNPISGAQRGPGLIGWVDATAPYDFHLQLFSDTIHSDFTGTFPVYYVIYKDMRLA